MNPQTQSSNPEAQFAETQLQESICAPAVDTSLPVEVILTDRVQDKDASLFPPVFVP